MLTCRLKGCFNSVKCSSFQIKNNIYKTRIKCIKTSRNHQNNATKNDVFSEIKKIDDKLSNRNLTLDEKGYFIIKVDHENHEIIAEHYTNTINNKGTFLHSIEIDLNHLKV